MTTTKRPYRKEDSYFFLDYMLFENGDPERVQYGIEEGEYKEGFEGIPRWVRCDFLTNYELMNHLNYIINHPYPHRYENIKIHSDEQLSQIVSIGEKTNEDGEKEYYRIWEHEEGYDEGEKMTLRQYKFGSNYEDLAKMHKSGEYPISVRG